MSKTALKIAGRHPMLLAFIMATAILGLLFSGWLTPAPSKAQTGGPNPSPGNENTYCPNYTTNFSCPTITVAEDLSPLSFCVEKGRPLPDPGWTTLPSADPGNVIITETCSNVVVSTGSITYSFIWTYLPPGKPTPAGAGTYSAIAKGFYVSSDTNFCPDADGPTWTVNWNVVDTNATKTSASVDLTPIYAGMEAWAEAIPVGWNCDKNAKFILEKEISTSHYCCSDESLGTKTVVSGSLSVNFGCSGNTPSYPIPITAGLVDVRLLCGLKVKGSVSVNSESEKCPNEPNTKDHYCIIPSGSLDVYGGIGVSVISSSLLDATGTVTGGGSLIGGQLCFYDDETYDSEDSKGWQFCYNDVSLTGTVTMLGGLEYSVSVVLLNGNCP